MRWQQDAAGAVSYYAYHPQHGHLAYSVRDVDPASLPGSADNNSTKWVTSSDGSASSNQPTRGGSLPAAARQITRHEFDSQGRLVLTAAEEASTGNILARHYTLYEAHRLLQFPYWDTTTNQPLLPIEATVFDDGGQVTEQYSVDPADGAERRRAHGPGGRDRSNALPALDAAAVRCGVGRTDRHAPITISRRAATAPRTPIMPRRSSATTRKAAAIGRWRRRHDHAQRVRQSGPPGEPVGGYRRCAVQRQLVAH